MKIYKAYLPEIELKYKSGQVKKAKITSSADCYELLKQMYDADTIDYFESSIALYLNRANNTIAWHKVSQGGISGTVIDGKIIFATALKCGASSIILSHNHPSARLEPSESDIRLTKNMIEFGKYIDLEIIDHLIITSEGYYSFLDEGRI